MLPTHLTLFLDFNRAHALSRRRFDAELGSVHGIGLNDLQLLDALERAPERRLRRIDLARELGVTASGVTWMLRPLAKRRLVASAASETDARATFAVITEAGVRLLAEARPTAQRLAEELLAPHVRKQELARIAEAIALFV